MNYRRERLSGLLEREIGLLIERGMDVPPGVMITVTGVRVSDDGKAAEVGVSVLPSAETKRALLALERARREFQSELFHKIEIRPFPIVSFFADHGLENAARVEEVVMKNGSESDRTLSD